VDTDFDLVVVGAGGAGLAAAATAAGDGARVLLVDAAREPGGSTALSGGSFMAAGTHVQDEAGHPGDSVAEFVDYYLALNQWQVDPAVVRRFCERATPTLTWLEELGVQFSAQGLYRAQLERFPRSHRPVGAGQALVDALLSRCRDARVDMALGNRVEALVTDEGRVAGVRAGGEEVSCHAVVIATGGFGNNQDLLAAHLPEFMRAGEWVWSPAPDTCRGDGLSLGLSAGAGATGDNRGEVLLTPGFGHELEPFLPGWLVFVNRDGRRFVNEAAPYAALSRLVCAEGGRCWVVMDESIRASAKPNAASAMFGGGSWTADFLQARIVDGRIPTAGTLAELAQQIGVPAAMLESTVRRYNTDAVSGGDSRFGKGAADMKPLVRAPYYGIEVRAAVVALTGYGLRIDPDARVLAALDDEPIPGLYAAGEVTGSLLGPLYLGGGNAIGNALVFGRIAAQSALADQRRGLHGAAIG
jgi:fumarate reductase flavoprotein subunit